MLRFYLVTYEAFSKLKSEPIIEHYTCKAEDAEHAIAQTQNACAPFPIRILSVVITH